MNRDAVMDFAGTNTDGNRVKRLSVRAADRSARHGAEISRNV